MLLPRVVDTVILKGTGSSGEVQLVATCVEEQQPVWQNYSSPTSSRPMPTDVVHDDEIGRSNSKQSDDQTSFVDIEKDLQEKGKDLDQLPGTKMPCNKNSPRKSLSLEKVPLDKERDDVARVVTSLPSAKVPSHQFRPNSIRNNVKGGQLYSGSFKGNGSIASIGRDPDDVLAMETLFSPNQQLVATLNGSSSANTSSNSLGHNASKINSANTPPPPSLTALTTPSRKFGYGPVGFSTKPLLTQNIFGTGMRSLWRDREIKDVEPRYSDPLSSGAPSSFQQRVVEIWSLESETVRWERNKKYKKKNKQDRDS